MLFGERSSNLVRSAFLVLGDPCLQMRTAVWHDVSKPLNPRPDFRGSTQPIGLWMLCLSVLRHRAIFCILIVKTGTIVRKGYSLLACLRDFDI